jgi:hypothetical protein
MATTSSAEPCRLGFLCGDDTGAGIVPARTRSGGRGCGRACPRSRNTAAPCPTNVPQALGELGGWLPGRRDPQALRPVREHPADESASRRKPDRNRKKEPSGCSR